MREQAQALSTLASFVAAVDAVVAFAEAAVADPCVRPKIVPKERRCLQLDDVRHPVVERLFRGRRESFVPSTAALDDERQILVL